MKNKKKLKKRIGAILCAVVVAVSSFGVSEAYYGYTDLSGEEACSFTHSYCVDAFKKYTIEMPSDVYIPPSQNGYEYCAIFKGFQRGTPLYFLVYSAEPLVSQNTHRIETVRKSWSCSLKPDYTTHEVYSCSELSSNSTWNTRSESNVVYFSYFGEIYTNVYPNEFTEDSYGTGIVYSNHTIVCGNTGLPLVYPTEAYESSLGYLQNVSRKSTYIRGALYNYDEDSLTYHWYHDLQSSSGVDLTSGEYKIRHYISNATVKGYEKEDIVEMSEKYLMAEYDASQGYFSYLQKDYLEKIENYGYVEPSWIDVYFKGYFTLQHHYFQIVNTSTNEVGGYLHFYPKDVSGDSFGVEMEYEGLDDSFDVVEDGPSGYIDTSTGSGETIEDALENADQPKLDDLGGIEPLIESLEGYASQIGNVTSGVGAFLSAFPPWVVGLLGLSVAMLFVIIVVKALRG